jgi:hypothetical protein
VHKHPFLSKSRYHDFLGSTVYPDSGGGEQKT